MSIKLGPVLRFHGINNDAWRISILLTTQNETNPPQLTSSMASGEALGVDVVAIKNKVLAGSNWTVWRYDLEVPQTNNPQSINYSIQNFGGYSFTVPASESLPNCAYVSCNGFSDPKLMKKVSDHFERWRDLNSNHDKTPYHLLIMGGDQVYSDSMWQELPSLNAWSEKSNRFKLSFTAKMQQEVDDFFFKLYLKRWSQVDMSQAFSSIPTLMMWDDHDIFDGWGSYPKDQHESDVYQNIFRIAREYFSIFQLHGAQPPDGYFPGQTAFNAGYSAGKLGVLALDMRSERTLNQVISPASWNSVYGWLDSIPPGQFDHLFVMSSIPVVHADFDALESMLGIFPGQQ